MKARVTQLNFHKDTTFDPQGLLDYIHAKPYIIETKRHWWISWEYVIDGQTGCPRLFFCSASVASYLLDNRIKLV